MHVYFMMNKCLFAHKYGHFRMGLCMYVKYIIVLVFVLSFCFDSYKLGFLALSIVSAACMFAFHFEHTTSPLYSDRSLRPVSAVSNFLPQRTLTPINC